MPSGWVHATLDLIFWGRSYFDLHKKKDKPYESLGPVHRIINHDWYQKFGHSWTFLDPFPRTLIQLLRALRDNQGADLAEAEMVHITHDYFDRIWNDLANTERKYIEGFLIWILHRPAVLKNWAGVDVIRGRIHRMIGGREVWESCSGSRKEYKRVCKYVNVVLSNDQSLQNMIRLYG